MDPITSIEKPVSGAKRLGLFAGAGATILLFYLFSAAMVLFLLTILGCELILVMVLLRVGLANVMAQIMADHLRVLTVFFRSFWIRKAAEYQIALQSSDAPGLFSLLAELCHKSGVVLPNEVSLEMNMNAWVRLRGYRRGAGKTMLGIGYDLLAGLSVSEVEAVLAHELMHAKLVQRGYKRWLNNGLHRAARLANGLFDLKETARRAKQSQELTKMVYGVADKVTRLGARLVAACSRQDEFDADRGAAQLCGSNPMRSVLLKLEALSKVTARLPWHERVAQLQAGNGLSQWLINEMTLTDPVLAPDPAHDVFYKYSTHPSLRDRLAALPDVIAETPGSPIPAIGLLAQPDDVAEKLVSEIQRVSAEQEEIDTRRLRRFNRKSSLSGHLRPVQGLGVFIGLIGVIGGIVSLLAVGFSVIALVVTIGSFAVGFLLHRLGRYRERMVLAVPDFAVLQAAWQKETKWNAEVANQIAAELRGRITADRNRQRTLDFCAESYTALSQCDYLRAHVAARLGMDVDKNWAEGTLGYLIAASALGQTQQVQWALSVLGRSTGMVGFSTSWGVGWALMLCGDWVHAEAFLERARGYRPGDPTLLSLIALCQSRRGKLQSAIVLARQACTTKPANSEHAKLLIDLLLQGGYMREARDRLEGVGSECRKDPELMFSMVRLQLLLRDFSMAEEWTLLMGKNEVSPHWFIRLGQAFEVARKCETAATLYNDALAAGYYPEAFLGLARLEVQRRNKDQARRHILAALNLNRDLGEKAVGPLPLFHQSISQLISLEDPVPNCGAWIVHLNENASPAAIANTSFLIYASSWQEAQQSFRLILDALQPGTPPMSPTALSFREAPREQQPDVPVRRGVQGILN